MTIHLNKLNGFGGGAGGGGGDSKFPTIVTDSGSSLPSASGYELNDTFLNTTDKKIYKTEVVGYVANTNTTLTVDVDYTTGIASGFASGKECSRTGLTNLWYGNSEVHYSIKFKVSSVQNTPIVCFKYSTSSGTNNVLFKITNDGHINHSRYDSGGGAWATIFDKQILDTVISANTVYILNIVKTGENCSAQLTDENGTIIEEKEFTTQNLGSSTNSIFYGEGRINSTSMYASNLYVNLVESSGELVIPNTSVLSWDSGTSLTDKTEYADKTNGILYLYQDTELVKIGGSLTKKVYTISADNTSILDVSSDFTKIVDVLKNGVELALTDDYTISSGVITFVTALSTTDKITVKGE